jgi:ABC-type antimicrobial peptide transport system permease subunit
LTKIESRLAAAVVGALGALGTLGVLGVLGARRAWYKWNFGGGGDGGGGLLEYLSWTRTSLKVSFALALTRVLGVIIVAFVCGTFYPVRRIRNARFRPFPRKGRLGMDRTTRCRGASWSKNRVRAMI